MSKIKIKAILKTKDNLHIYEGKGIINNNQIIYNDNGITTKITLDTPLTIERTKDYNIKLGFKTNEIVKGTYIINEGTLETITKTKDLKIEKNSIKIKYNLKINSVNIDDFEYILTYTIDSM